jgi:CubicO group peptidase (beta-lactamase class C family)
MNLDAALTYAQRHVLHALLVVRDGATLFETYADGGDADVPHPLYSGTKAFWGLAAGAAHDDGLLDLDEPVAATIPAWREGARSRVTLRHVLSLTSGIGFGGLGTAVPTYDRALATELKDEPGERFTYGGIPLQVFGAVLATKLAPRNLTPHAYLRERLLDPIGVEVGSWRTLRDGTQPLPTGAFLTARAWARWGAFVLDGGRHDATRLVSESSFAVCFRGSDAGGQALYVIPAERTVIVKFGTSNAYKHEAFLKRLLR